MDQNIANRRKAIIIKKLLTEIEIMTIRNEMAETIRMSQCDIIPTVLDISNRLVNEREREPDVNNVSMENYEESNNRTSNFQYIKECSAREYVR